MPLHDWTRVDAGTFHDFHLRWSSHLTEALNAGLLPQECYARIEVAGGARAPSAKQRRRTLTIRHTSGHRIIALVEIVSPGNKQSADSVAEFVLKIDEALRSRIHVLVIDLLPPGPHDSAGMHGALTVSMGEAPYDLPADKPLTFVSYAAEVEPTAYLEHLAVGDVLPEMPLFLTPERYLNLPLEPSYNQTFRTMPGFYREALEGRRAAP